MFLLSRNPQNPIHCAVSVIMTRSGEILGIIVWGWHLGHFCCIEGLLSLIYMYCGELVNNF
jgi:hypothetical protein